MTLFDWLLARKQAKENCGGGTSGQQYKWNVLSCPTEFANNPTFELEGLHFIKIAEHIGTTQWAMMLTATDFTSIDLSVPSAASGVMCEILQADEYGTQLLATYDKLTVYILSCAEGSGLQADLGVESGAYIALLGNDGASATPDYMQWVMLYG